MLTEPQITALLPTVKPERAKQFYRNILGLELVSEDPYGLEFRGQGTSLRVTVVPALNPQPFTVLGFKIANITSHVKTLNDKGVVFEKYEQLNQDELGIWTSPGKAKVAWFKDPDGNLLSLTEYPNN